jgi:hypothetical protein
MVGRSKKSSKGKISTHLRNDFWFWTFLPTVLSLIIGFYLSYKAGYYFKPDIDGLNIMYKDFKVLFYIAGLSIPASGIYAAIKRSEETNHQIKLSENQNNFNNYYKHLEEYKKTLEAECDRNNLELNIHPNQMHKFVFPDFDFEIPEPASETFNKLSELLLPKPGLRLQPLFNNNTEEEIIKTSNLASQIHKEPSLQFNYKTNHSIINFFMTLSISIKYSPFSKKTVTEQTTSFNKINEFSYSASTYENIIKNIDPLSEISKSAELTYFTTFYIFHLKEKTPYFHEEEVLKKIESIPKKIIDQSIEINTKRLGINKNINIKIKTLDFLKKYKTRSKINIFFTIIVKAY